MRALALACLCAVTAYGCAGAGQTEMKSDWQIQQEKLDWQENPTQLPAFPKPQELLEFYVGPASDFRFFIDQASLGVGSDRVVRYVLVARSPSGAQNISYEGMRCESASYRIYATGRRDGTWTKAREDRWRPIGSGAMNWRRALQTDYFCPQGIAIHSAAEGIAALKRGGAPDARPYAPSKSG